MRGVHLREAAKQGQGARVVALLDEAAAVAEQKRGERETPFFFFFSGGFGCNMAVCQDRLGTK